MDWSKMKIPSMSSTMAQPDLTMTGMMTENIKRPVPTMRIVLITAVNVFLLDFVTKWAATASLTPEGFPAHKISIGQFLLPSADTAQGLMNPNYPPYEFIPGCFNFYLAHNTGGAFSVMSGNALLLGLISLIVVGGIAWWARSFSRRHILPFIAAGMVIGGALGNIADRFRFGYVVDFIDWYWGQAHWPTFNIADSFIDVGLGILIILAIFTKQLDGDKVEADTPEKVDDEHPESFE